MSAQFQGFVSIIAGKECLFPLEGLDELRGMQELLRAIHFQPQAVWCGCGATEEKRRYLCVHQWPLQERLGLRRAVEAEHPAHCLFSREDDGQAELGDFSSNIFAADGTTTYRAKLTAGEVVWPYPLREHFRYSRYVSHVIAEAQVGAFLSENQGRDTMRTASATAWLGAIDQVLGRPLFEDGRSSYTAAREHGARIRFGLVNEALELGDNVAGLLNLNWWSSGHLVSETLCVPATVWAAAIGEACVWGQLMAPPYLAVAVAEADGFVRRLRLYACYGDGRYLVPVESQYERAFCAFLVSQDLAFIKPVLRTDLDKVLPPLGVRLLEPLGFRCDFGVFKRRMSGAIRVYVTELRGFPSGEFATYDGSLSEKARKVRERGEPFAYKEPFGADYQFTQVADPVWENLAIGWKGPSPSADWWLRHSAGEAGG